MSRRKKKARTGPRFEWLRNINWGNVRRAAIAACWLVGGGALVAAAIYGVPYLEKQALAQAQVHPDDVEIRFANAPAWFRADLEAELVHKARMSLNDDPLQRPGSEMRDLPAIRHAMLTTGWFQEVHQVRRVHAGLIEIDTEFADPVALVRNHEGDHLIDSRGRLLPQWFSRGTADHFTVIVGTQFDRPARPGLEWPGADVVAALRVLKIVEQQSWRSQVRMIDVTGHLSNAGTGTIKLITDRGSWILWGSAPGDEAPMEADTKRKLQFLNHNDASFQHIDGNHRGEVDITDQRRVINR